MIKLILKFSIICSFVFSGLSQAGVITTDLTEDNYIVHEDSGLDIAWVSPISFNFYYENELFSPDALHLDGGWRYATDEELIVISSLTLEDFIGYNAQNEMFYKHAVEYWNTVETGIDIDDFEAGKINSNWEASGTAKWDYETFYVRATDVPEPSTLFIFAIALIAIAGRKKLLNYF